jgi:hypothetical protein
LLKFYTLSVTDTFFAGKVTIHDALQRDPASSRSGPGEQNLSRTRVRWSPSLFRPWRRAKPCIMDTIDHKQISWIVNREC